jgi:hypothetical protein
MIGSLAEKSKMDLARIGVDAADVRPLGPSAVEKRVAAR